jgi:hypothetical protein
MRGAFAILSTTTVVALIGLSAAAPADAATAAEHPSMQTSHLTHATPQGNPCGQFSNWLGEVYYNNCAPTPYMVDVWVEVTGEGDPHEWWACLARGTNDLGFNNNLNGDVTTSTVGPCTDVGTWTPIG